MIVSRRTALEACAAASSTWMQRLYGRTKATASYAHCYLFGILFPVLYLAAIRSSKQGPQIWFHCFQSLTFFSVWLPLYFVPFTSRGEEVMINFIGIWLDHLDRLDGACAPVRGR